MTAKGVRKKVDKAYGTDSLGIFQTQKPSEGYKKPFQMAFWGAFPEFLFLMPRLTSPRSLDAWDIAMLRIALSLFSLIFLAFISVLARPVKKYSVGKGWLKGSYCNPNQCISKSDSHRKKCIKYKIMHYLNKLFFSISTIIHVSYPESRFPKII